MNIIARLTITATFAISIWSWATGIGSLLSPGEAVCLLALQALLMERDMG